MKLLYCLKCHSMVRLVEYERSCECKACKGRYIDAVRAVYSGPALPIGIDNASFKHAISMQPKRGMGISFKAFIIPEKCATFKKVSDV